MTSPSLYAILTPEHRQDAARLLTEAIPDTRGTRAECQEIERGRTIGVALTASGIKLVVIGVIEA